LTRCAGSSGYLGLAAYTTYPLSLTRRGGRWDVSKRPLDSLLRKPACRRAAAPPPGAEAPGRNLLGIGVPLVSRFGSKIRQASGNSSLCRRKREGERWELPSRKPRNILRRRNLDRGRRGVGNVNSRPVLD
jgi:hypothetical protein